jgi:hypothetical protein
VGTDRMYECCTEARAIITIEGFVGQLYQHKVLICSEFRCSADPIQSWLTLDYHCLRHNQV